MMTFSLSVFFFLRGRVLQALIALFDFCVALCC